MFFSLESLERHPIDFEEEFPPETLELGADLHQAGILKSSGRASLVEEHHGPRGVIQDIRVVGGLSTSVEVSCARCLEPVSRKIDRAFDLLYRPQGSDAGREEISVTATEAEIGYYRGDGLQLEEVLREQVLLAVPYKVLCREECKGLCPRCGRNLNTERCACAEPLTDPRWDALKKLRNLSS